MNFAGQARGKLRVIGAVAALSLVVGAALAAEPTKPPQPLASPGQDSPVAPWPAEPRWRGPGPMPRHHMAIVWGIPAPYTEMTNPQRDRATILQRGAAIYARNCQSCHGKEGVGDGPDGRNLSPSPGNLVWLSDVPRKQWDAYMYWTIAEGGTALGTAMPAYKSSLTADEIWAVTAYVQAYLPFDSHWR